MGCILYTPGNVCMIDPIDARFTWPKSKGCQEKNRNGENFLIQLVYASINYLVRRPRCFFGPLIHSGFARDLCWQEEHIWMYGFPDWGRLSSEHDGWMEIVIAGLEPVSSHNTFQLFFRLWMSRASFDWVQHSVLGVHWFFLTQKYMGKKQRIFLTITNIFGRVRKTPLTGLDFKRNCRHILSHSMYALFTYKTGYTTEN